MKRVERMKQTIKKSTDEGGYIMFIAKGESTRHFRSGGFLLLRDCLTSLMFRSYILSTGVNSRLTIGTNVTMPNMRHFLQQDKFIRIDAICQWAIHPTPRAFHKFENWSKLFKFSYLI